MEYYFLMFFTFMVILYKTFYKFGIKFLQNFGVIESDPVGNPFLHDARLPVKPIVIDQQSRDAVLRQDFKVKEVPANLDAIVIGSGIGGLSIAAILSKAGKKVLVLEQHEQAGGCCHSFIENGYEFNMGIHYVGEMNVSSIYRTYIDQISEGQIQWDQLDEEYDVALVRTGKEDYRKYSINGDVEKQKSYLKAQFPDEVSAIDKYYDCIDELVQTSDMIIFPKFLPLWLVKLIELFGIDKWITKFYYYNRRTAKEFIDELTSNQTLRDLFCYNWCIYGVTPSKVGFPTQAFLTAHYFKGAYFPVGGASQIPLSIIPVIERGGGKVLVHAEVIEILIGEKGQAVGVKVKHGQSEHDIFAPIVISDAGILNTEKILKSQPDSMSYLRPFITLKDSVGLMTVLIGLNVSSSELNIATKKNYYVALKNDVDKSALDYLNLSKEECAEAELLGLYISFCSSKDPSYEKRFPGKSTMTVFLPTNYSWFEEWENKPVQHRGDDYVRLKNTFGSKAMKIIMEIFPQIKDHIDYVHFRSPLSFNNTLRRTKGPMNGMDHDQTRSSLISSAMIQSATKISGLYLTGQDIISCSFKAAAVGGLLCAQQVLDRPLPLDLLKLHTKLMKYEEPDKKKKYQKYIFDHTKPFCCDH